MRRRPDPRRRWLAVGLLGVLGAALGLGGVGLPAAAQTAPDDPSSAFGGFTSKGRANGVQVTYDLENVLPLPPPLLQISVPEALATSGSGPTASALGSAAFPGNVLGNLPAIIEQAAPGNGGFVPPYPLQARADYPAGPVEASQEVGTLASTVSATPTGADAVSTMAATDIPGLITFGAITTAAHTGFEDGQVVARSRAEFASIDLLFGLIHLEGVVTDLVATTNGETAAASGTTTVANASILGIPAVLGRDGLVIGEFTPPANPGPFGLLIDQLAGLGELGGALADAVTPLNQLIAQIVGTANAGLNDLLAAAGIHIGILEPIVNVDGPKASITGNGLVIRMVFDGSGDNPLAQLLALIPTDQLPAEGIPGFPLNTSPQALVNLLKETHVTGVAAAYGTAEVIASPAFTAAPPASNRPTTPSPSGSISPSTPGRTTSPNFTTSAPPLPPPPPAAEVETTAAGAIRGTAISALIVVLALLSSPLWAIGSRRLADGVLAASGNACPDGLDRPIPEGPG